MKKQKTKQNIKPKQSQQKITTRQSAVVDIKDINKNATEGIISNKWIAYAIILMLSIVLYFNTIPYDYVLDDKAVITNNQFTKQGFKGVKAVMFADIFEGIKAKQKNYVAGGRYRPLSLVTFALEWGLFATEVKDNKTITPNTQPQQQNETTKEGNPHISHVVNIVLYALTGILIYLILSKLFLYRKDKLIPDSKLNKWFMTVPFITTILYMTHPLHSEAVANIKGRDEIMIFMFLLMSLWFTIKYIEHKQIKHLIFSGISIFLGYLSKENAITFLAIIPLTIYFFIPVEYIAAKSKQLKVQKSEIKSSVAKQYIVILIPLLISTIAFLILRYNIVGGLANEPSKDLMNNPFFGTSFAEEYATIFYTLGYYIKLLFFPHPLTFDYYPKHIEIINWLDYRAIVPLILYLSIGIYSLFGIKKRSIISYGIWFYLISLSILSNIFFPIGAFLSERFMFIPSLGFCLIIVYLILYRLPLFIQQKIKSDKIPVSAFAGILILIAILFSAKTITRNTVWENEFTLFTTDIKTSKNSAKGNYAAGFAYITEGKKPENAEHRDSLYKTGIEYLEKSLVIHPTFENVLIFLATSQYEYNKDYKKAIEYDLRALKMYPHHNNLHQHILWMLEANPEPINIDYKLSIYEKMYKLNSNRFDLNLNYGLKYFLKKQNWDKAIFYLEKALVSPEGRIDAARTQLSLIDAYKILGISYLNKVNYKKAAENLEQAAKLKNTDLQTYQYLYSTYLKMGATQQAENALKQMNLLTTQK